MLPKKRSTRTADCCADGCDERAKYVPHTFTIRFPTRCKDHAQPRTDYFEYTNRLCENETCSGRASFAPHGERPLRCATHQQRDDVNVAKKLCECGRAKPFFGPPGTIGAVRCSSCKVEGDVDLNNKKCVSCKTRQVAAVVESVEGIRVMSHCMQCANRLALAHVNGRVPYCACGVQASFDVPGTIVSAVRFCGSCRDPDLHVDIKHDGSLCQICYETRGHKHVDGVLHCARCFYKTHPGVPNQRNYKNKENAVAEFLYERFSERFTMTFDRQVARVQPAAEASAGALEQSCRSSGRKPDVLIDMGEWVVVVEVDENQHKQSIYKTSSCETKRTMQIFQDAGSRPVVFVRFNPDGYKDAEGHVIRSPWTVDGRTRGVQHVPVENRSKWADRLETLADAIISVTSTRPTKEVTNLLLYFDGY